MSVAVVSQFVALLSLAAWAGAAGIAVLGLVVRDDRWDGLRVEVGRVALPLAFAVACVTTAGSLYYSEVAGYTPCELCWYQRIAAYPLAVLLGIAVIRRDTGVRPYVIGLCVAGAPISLYHSYIQAFPPDSPTTFCTDEAPCTVRYVWELGFVSLPMMALSAFVSIAALMLATRWADGDAGADESETVLTEAAP